jgi:hypothetical protein
MQYLLTIYIDESAVDAVPPEQGVKVTEAYEALTAELKQAGVFLGGEGLQRTSTATTVRVRDGEPLLTDGPFAETREQLGGFYVLECKDIDEAAGWAAKVPDLGEGGSVEVRPVVDWDAASAEEFGAETSAG